jgi:nucleotide-binding universal stress UspA family protein
MTAQRSRIRQASLTVAQRLWEEHAPTDLDHTDERAADHIIRTWAQREQSEITCYPHTGGWTLLRQGAPLLFWPPEECQATQPISGAPQIGVPLDGHLHAERAIPLACALATLVGGEVVLLYVVPRPGRCAAERGSHITRQAALRAARAARNYLREARVRAAAHSSAVISTKLLLGEPGEALVAFAQRPQVGAMALTAHSQLRGQRFFAGAVATQLVRQARTPILLVPLGQETEPQPPFALRTAAVS